MVAEGFSRKAAHRHRTLDLVVAQADYRRRRDLGQGHGAIVEAWDLAPPLAPAADPQRAPLISSADAARRAQAIAPQDASEEEISLLAGELESGSTDDQALDWLAGHRAFQARWSGAGGSP